MVSFEISNNQCERLGYQMYCELCYRPWFAFTHGTSGYSESFFGKGGQGQMHAIRAIAGYQETIALAVTMITELFSKLFPAVLPRHHARFARFYKNQFRRQWAEVEKTRIVLKESRVIHTRDICVRRGVGHPNMPFE